MKKIILPLIVIAASGAYVWSQQGRIAAESLMVGDSPSLDATAAPDTPADGPAPAAAVAKAPDLQPVPAPAASAVGNAAPAVPADSALTPSASMQALPSALSIPAETAWSPAIVRAPSPAVQTQAPTSNSVVAPVPLAPPPRRIAPAATITLAAATLPAAASTGQYKNGSFTGGAADAYYGLVQVQANVQGGQLASVRILQYPNDRNTSRYINAQALPMLKREAIQAQSANVDFISGATFTSQAYVRSLADALDQAKL